MNVLLRALDSELYKFRIRINSQGSLIAKNCYSLFSTLVVYHKKKCCDVIQIEAILVIIFDCKLKRYLRSASQFYDSPLLLIISFLMDDLLVSQLYKFKFSKG